MTFFRGTVYLDGWAFAPGHAVVAATVWAADQPLPLLTCAGYGLDSPDVAAAHGPEAAHCRFAFAVPFADSAATPSLRLVFTLADGRLLPADGLTHHTLHHDPYHVLQREFFALLAGQEPGAVLEIGARARSGHVRRGLLPPGWTYTGLDILPGENVDVVGDAHALGGLFPAGGFDALFSMSVFEHLLMPWKVVLEMNKVLRPGGLVMITTHQSFPLHETPWDFFRFSDQAWHGLFNEATGFEVVRTALGEPVSLVTNTMHPALFGLENCPAFIGSAVLARKTGGSRLSWDVDVARIVDTMYPV